MKGPTPIKRHQALVSLSRDHHFSLLLVWKIKQGLANAIEPERISNYVLYFFEEDLQPHFKEEEQIVFPKLPADNALRLQAEKEHAIIYDLVNRLRMDKTNKELLQQLGEILKEHIRFEERVLFTYMQQTLPTAVLDEMANQEEKRRRDADAAWQDVFWVVDKSGL